MQHESDPNHNGKHSGSRANGSGWEGFTYTSESVKNGFRTDQRLQSSKPVSAEVTSLRQNSYPLSAAQVGDYVRIISLNCGESNNRLMAMGFMPDVVLHVASCTATGSVIVAVQDQRLGLGTEIAQRIQVINAQAFGGDQVINPVRMTAMQSTPEVSTVKLRDVAIGTTLRVMGYEPTARDYKRKLLAMGLTPGTELRVTRHAPLGDPTEISVRGFQLSLRKAEADALIVSPVTGS